MAKIKHFAHINALLLYYATSKNQPNTCHSLPHQLQPIHRAKIASSIAKSQRRAAERSIRPRERCNHCNRPLVQCLCEALPRQKISLRKTEVLVLQHPNEFRRSTISTVPLLDLVLDDVSVVVGHNFDLETRVIKEAIEKNYTLALLYPSEDAIDLDDPTAEEKEILSMFPHDKIASTNDVDDTKKTLLIACDGTWTQAKRMFYNSPDLISKCHQIQFTSNVTTIYDRIRTEPEDHCLSTSEAIAEALIRLEPNGVKAKNYINSALEKLVEVQLQYSLDTQQSDPRFTRRKQKVFNKRQNRLHIEQTMFNDTTFDLGDGSILRPLQQSDAAFVSRMNDDRSIHKIADLIRYYPKYCFGIERNHKLIACLLRYRSGEIGMLYVHSEYRRKGYASLLIQEFMRRIHNYEDAGFAETFIVDGNIASQATFRSLGWRPEDENAKKGTGKRRAKRKWICRF